MLSLRTLTHATALSVPLLFVAAMSQVWAEPHDHHDLSTASLELNQGQKWAIDEALREGMNAIHGDINSAIERIHANQMSGADYSQLADNMNTPFAHIVANCKLPAEADAQLHIVLANMMQGVDTIQGKTGDQQPEQGVVGIAQTLNSYGNFFQHDGWQSFDLSH